MAHHREEHEAACDACKATGLYVGLAEKNGSAVVCHTCRGTGRVIKIIEWDDFQGRRPRPGVVHVVQVNPGIGIGCGGGYTFRDFGGMSYEDWRDGRPFPPKSEMRKFTCPAWWWQSADYSKKPNWEECIIAGSFSSCEHFKDKAGCWARFDREQEGKK